MRIMKSALIAGLTLVVAASGTPARDLARDTVRVEAKGAKRLDIKFHFGAGELHLTPADQHEVAMFDMSYDDRYYDHDISYEVVDGTGELDIDSKHDSDDEIDTEKNIWDVRLSDEYPTELSLDVGACDAKIDLGGIPLEQLSIDIGAASADLNFSRPNPRTLERVKIEAGASSLDIKDIGNAHFKDFDFDGGVGSYDLDFRGDYDGESTISLDIGLGSADIILPEDVACRVEVEGGNLLSSVDFHNDDLDEVDDDVHETPGFSTAKTRIILRLKVGLGSIDVYFK